MKRRWRILLWVVLSATLLYFTNARYMRDLFRGVACGMLAMELTLVCDRLAQTWKVRRARHRHVNGVVQGPWRHR